MASASSRIINLNAELEVNSAIWAVTWRSVVCWRMSLSVLGQRRYRDRHWRSIQGSSAYSCCRISYGRPLGWWRSFPFREVHRKVNGAISSFQWIDRLDVSELNLFQCTGRYDIVMWYDFVKRLWSIFLDPEDRQLVHPSLKCTMVDYHRTHHSRLPCLFLYSLWAWVRRRRFASSPRRTSWTLAQDSITITLGRVKEVPVRIQLWRTQSNWVICWPSQSIFK